jgi:hypothetical protein
MSSGSLHEVIFGSYTAGVSNLDRGESSVQHRNFVRIVRDFGI